MSELQQPNLTPKNLKDIDKKPGTLLNPGSSVQLCQFAPFYFQKWKIITRQVNWILRPFGQSLKTSNCVFVCIFTPK